MKNKKDVPTTSVNRAKTPRRLLVQVGLIFGIFFGLIILITSILVVKGNMSTYLEAKQEMLTPILLRAKAKLLEMPQYAWFLDFWEEHQDKIVNTYNEEDIKYLQEKGFVTSFNNPDLSLEQLESADYKTQCILASSYYYSFSLEMNLSQWQLNNEHLFCMDISDKSPGLIYVLGTMDDNAMHSTESWDIYIRSLGVRMDLSGHKAIETLRNGTYGKDFGDTIFERFESSRNGEYNYLGYAPVMVDNKVRCVIAIAHNWSDFHSKMMLQLVIMTVSSAAIIVLAGAILLYYINRAAIHPLRRIQSALQSYMQTKDSRDAVEKMGQIRLKNEFGVLAQNVADLAVEIDRYTNENNQLTAERERVSTELSLATAIQDGALPKNFPTEPDYMLYASMTPAKEVGGDFYDFFTIDETHIGLVIGDVSGKGVPASLYMMMSQLLIRQYARAGYSPAQTLEETNKVLCENNKMEMFVTAWFGILDRTTGTIIATSAGHEFPILRNAVLPPDKKKGRDPEKIGNEFVLFKDRHGFVLGGMDMTKYREYEFSLNPGGTLFVYTDGAPEATNADEELFGTDRMLAELNRTPEAGPKELTEAMHSAIDRFVGEAPQFDDLTMLCIRYYGNVRG